MRYNAYQPLRRPSQPATRPPVQPLLVPVPPPPPPPERRGRGRLFVVLLCAVLFAGLCVAVGTDLVMRRHGSAAAAAGVDSPAPTIAPHASLPPESRGPFVLPAHPKTLLSIDGRGNGATQQFTTGTDWYLRYSYDCAEDKGGNVKIFEYSTTDSGTMLVDESDQDGTDTLPQHGAAGRRYLTIASTCSWTVTIIG